MTDHITQAAITTFHTNLLFLQENHPALFEKISSLNLAIEKGYHSERYSLEYTEAGYFDVLETETGRWLYGTDSRKHAELAAKSIDFTKEGNLFETFYNIDISKEASETISKQDISQSSMAGSASLIYYANTYASKKNTTMKKLYKFIFLGTGLGLHITEIHKKLHSYVYLIIEDDLELFRLSLFVTDYRRIAEEAIVIFSVFEDDATFDHSLKQFFEEFFFYNHYLKYFNILSHSDQKLRTIQHFIARQNHLVFNYAPLITSTLRPLEHLRNGYRFFNFNTFDPNKCSIGDKPALLLAAGPSFQKQIPWLQKNHDKFIIIAVPPLLSKLEELGIKPDIITHLDGFDPALLHIQKIKDFSFFDTTICLFGSFTQPRLANYFKKENIYFIEGTSAYKEGFGRLTSSNIGSYSLALMLLLQIKSIYLLGLDFALDQESGHTHSDTHSYSAKKELKESTEIGETVVFAETVIKIRGNFADEVFTTLVYDDMRRDCNNIIQVLKTADSHIYNFSDGAYIDETIPTDIHDATTSSYHILDKEAFFTELKTSLDSSSEYYLKPSEITALEHRIRYCNALISILDTHLHTPHPTLDHFHYNLLTMFRNLLAESGDEDIAHILLLYFQYVSGYLFDLINTKEIDSTKKMIKHINKAIIPQMKRIVEYIRDTLEKYRKFEAERKSGED